MNGLTNYITERPWLDTITAWYVHVDDAYVFWWCDVDTHCARVGRSPRFRTVKLSRSR